MKKFFSKVTASLIFVALAACGGSPEANAAPSVDSPLFVAANGAVYSLQDFKILNTSALAGSIEVTYQSNGGTTYISDSTGALLTKLQGMQFFKERFVLVGTGLYVNIYWPAIISCTNNQITVGWDNAGATYYADSGCSNFTTNIKGVAN